MSPALHELPTEERPRERLRAQRARALSGRELLALVLGSGGAGRSAVELAGELLAAVDGSLRRLARSDPAALEAVPGIGPARSAALAAAFELGRRAAAEPGRRSARVRGPRDVHRRLGPALRDLRQEEFWAVYLDTQNRVLEERRLTVGLLDVSLIDPREVFRPALTLAARSVLLVHNHPSGDPEPSEEDAEVTRQLAAAGELLGIPVRDHVVVGDGRYVSLMERGLLGSS